MFDFCVKRKSRLVLNVLLLLSLVMPAALSTRPASADWGPVIQLVNPASSSPAIAVTGYTVEAVWTLYQTIQQVHYQRSTNGGRTWSTDVTLSDPAIKSSHPAIAVDGGVTHVVFTAGSTSSQNSFYVHSLDGGQTWGTRLALTGDNRSFMPKIAASGSYVYVAYLDDAAGPQAVFFRRSSDGGLTWDPAVQISTGSISSDTCSIAVSGNLVHVVWMDNGDGTIYYSRSANNGQTWSAVALPTGGNQCFYPAVAATGNYVHIAFLRVLPTGEDVRYVRSVDGGLTLEADTFLGSSIMQHLDPPAITAFGEKVYAAWGYRVDSSTGQYNYKQSDDNGSTWSGEQVLMDGVTWGIHPAPVIAAQGTNLYAVWQDMRGGPALHAFYRKNTVLVPVERQLNTSRGLVRLQANDGRFIAMQAVLPACTPAGYTFPYGMFSFMLDGLIPGDNVTMTIILPISVPAGCKYFKCQDGNPIDCSAFAKIQDNIITLTLTDGGNGDADHLANGVIVDPGGPAFPVRLIQTTGGSSLPQTPPAPQSPVTIANIKVQGASLSDSKVTPGSPVTVTARVSNTGAVNGTARVIVYVNGQEETGQGVTVNKGSTTSVNFTVNRSDPGTYTVHVGDVQAGSFVVDDMAGSNILVFASLAMIGLALIMAAIYLARRRQALP